MQKQVVSDTGYRAYKWVTSQQRSVAKHRAMRLEFSAAAAAGVDSIARRTEACWMRGCSVCAGGQSSSQATRLPAQFAANEHLVQQHSSERPSLGRPSLQHRPHRSRPVDGTYDGTGREVSCSAHHFSNAERGLHHRRVPKRPQHGLLCFGSS